MQYESNLGTGEEGTRSDIELFFNSICIHADICAMHPAASSYLNLANRLGGAAPKREREQRTINVDPSSSIPYSTALAPSRQEQ